jgi:drug/metabolite transporter (DMT)-like permease
METIGRLKEKRAELTLFLAFTAIYVVWGSTYLAMHYVLESMPPFLMAASRFLIAGFILILFSRFKKQSWPTKTEIKNSALIGFLLLVTGGGGVVWAQQFIPSGITALIITIEPVWVVLILWIRSTENKPTPVVWLGIILGMLGMTVLIGPASLNELEQLHPVGVIVLLTSSISWAIGSVYALKVQLPSSSSMSTGFQMLAASFFMLMIGSFREEWTSFEFSEITNRSILGFIYLIVFGSLIGFTSYGYLVKKASPTSVSTYAYVNPVIAVFLGWWIGNERVGTQTMLAAALLVSAVVLIIMKPDWKFNFSYKKIKT